jgi:hypothetical protein
MGTLTTTTLGFVFEGNVGDYLEDFGRDLRPVRFAPRPIFRRRPKRHAKPRRARR